MEAAIRWSPYSTHQDPRFLIIDVAANRLRLCQIDKVERNRVEYRQLCVRDKLPNYTAFDWSKRDEHLVAIGSASGEAVIVQVDADRPHVDYLHSFSIKHQRKCNSIAFSSKNYLATGLDRVRNDVCLNIYDLNQPSLSPNTEPYKKMASSEAISSIKFFNGQPDTLVAGVSRQCIRIYDLRDSGTAGVAQYPTRQVHNIAIDPLDENYFISAGTTGDPTVTVWDQRFMKQRNPTDPASSESVLEFRPIVDNSHSATIWSLRYSNTKRGTFGVLANTGEFKVVELAQHSHKPDTPQQAPRIPATSSRSWLSPYYTKASHHLRYPSYDERSGGESRVLAYDFMAAGSPVLGQCALTFLPNRDVEILEVPAAPPHVNITALEEIYRDRTLVAKPSPIRGTISDDLTRLQNETLKEKFEISHEPKDSLLTRLDQLTIDHPERSIPLESASRTNYQMHETLLTLAYPQVRLTLPDYLKTLQTQKRRCKEGYNLDCRRNKEIVANDQWLVDAWNFVERMDAQAWGDGMAGTVLDLKYLGVWALWSNKLEMYDQRMIDPDAKTSKSLFLETVKEICENKEFPPFSGAPTDYPENRQLCLSLCGWNLSKKGLRERCSLLVDEGQYYKAIVLAVFQGYKEVALDLLKETIQQKRIENIGLGAVIACESVNEEQRHLCAWMADMTDDPYLKGLLQYFITGDWGSVVEMPQLSLYDRVGVALKYLRDDRLTNFINMVTREAIAYGNIEGLLLTGFTNRVMDLFEHYIAKYGDLQSAVLILSRACPLYIQDPRWGIWKDAYFNQMQVWRTFLERTRYIKEHNLRSVSREGKSLSKPSSPSLAIRCFNCQQNLALRKDAKTSRQYLAPVPSNLRSGKGPKSHRTGPAQAPHRPKGIASSPALACPNCGAQMPRCGLCLMWLGSPDPSKVGAAQGLKEEDLEARLMVFCMTFRHARHKDHQREHLRQLWQRSLGQVQSLQGCLLLQQDCQKAQWKRHKVSCNAPPHELDQYMRRAGKVLQEVFFLWAEQTYGYSIASVTDTGKELIVYDGVGQPGRFYKHVRQVMAYFKELVDDMLLGANCALAEKAFKPKLPDRRIRVITPHAGEYALQVSYHRVILVTSADSTRQWVLDPTGYQYNQVQPTVEAKLYAVRCVDKVLQTEKWGAVKVACVNFAECNGYIGLIPRISIAGTQACYEAIKTWEETSHTTLSQLLRETDDHFEKGYNSLMAAVKVAVQDFVKNADFEDDILESAMWEETHPNRDGK